MAEQTQGLPDTLPVKATLPPSVMVGVAGTVVMLQLAAARALVVPSAAIAQAPAASSIFCVVRMSFLVNISPGPLTICLMFDFSDRESSLLLPAHPLFQTAKSMLLIVIAIAVPCRFTFADPLKKLAHKLISIFRFSTFLTFMS